MPSSTACGHILGTAACCRHAKPTGLLHTAATHRDGQRASYSWPSAACPACINALGQMSTWPVHCLALPVHCCRQAAPHKRALQPSLQPDTHEGILDGAGGGHPMHPTLPSLAPTRSRQHATAGHCRRHLLLVRQAGRQAGPSLLHAHWLLPLPRVHPPEAGSSGATVPRHHCYLPACHHWPRMQCQSNGRLAR
jgi:hypothetical protein